MFIRIILLSFTLCLGIYWFSIRVTPEDRIQYNKLMTESIELRTQRALEEQPAHQIRQQVEKEMWTKNETSKFTIHSEDSNLTIIQNKDKTELIEKLHNITLSTPELTLTADYGLYTFPLQDTLSFENPKGHILSQDLHFTAKSLLWEKEKDVLHLIDDVKITQLDDLVLHAKQGIVELSKFQPTRVILQDDVQLISSRIQGKDGHAMAETLVYDPQNQTLVFSGQKRVLFWQEGLRISANELVIHKDQTVVGHGDVHFSFDLEEQNHINKFFNRYL